MDLIGQRPINRNMQLKAILLLPSPKRCTTAIAVIMWLIAPCMMCSEAYVPSSVVPPKPMREFRGAWVASVGNIDWPSTNGLTTAQQKAELLAILNRTVKLKLNTILLQVRPACDAMYPSNLEPWSE